MNSAEMKAIASRAVSVTLFEDRAEVTRAVTVAPGAGVHWVAVTGVSRFVDDRSMRAEADGATVLTTRVVRRIVSERGGGADEVLALEDALSALRRKITDVDLRIAAAEKAIAQAVALSEAWITKLAAVPHGIGGDGGLAEWEASAAGIDAARTKGRLALGDATDERRELVREFELAAARLAEARTSRSREETHVAVQLDVAGDGNVEIRCIYRVPCALWRPEHLARFDAGTLQITTCAVAWQITGESWENVRMRFSTARPARPTLPPLLSEDVLTLRRKTDEERKQVVVAAREQAIQVAGAEGQKKDVEEMPGVDDGGEPLTFEAKEPVTMPSTGRGLRVEIAAERLDAKGALVLIAEKAQAPHWRVTGTWKASNPLLSGPVRVARGGELIGRSRVDFVAAGDGFELGFGPDDAVRARRATRVENDTQMITGKQKRRHFVTLHLSNTAGESRDVELVERMPVSEIEGLEVVLVKGDGWTLDAKDGFLRRTASLPARTTQTIEWSYELRAGSNVVLPD